MLAHHETNATPHSPLPFETEHFDVLALLDQAGVPYRATGATEIEADVENTGHYSFKISTEKGLWICTDGSGRTGNAWGLRRILRERGLGATDEPRVWVPRYKDPEQLRREWQELAEGVAQKMRLVWGVWVGAHTPHEWDFQPGHRRHAEVEAARKYFDSRGFKGRAVILSGGLRIGKPDPRYDKAYAEAGCVAVLLFPMYAEDGALVGLQRLYIDADGRKVEAPKAPARKMLGVKGTLRIKPTRRHPWSEAVMVHDDRVAVGEGFESTLALAEALGCKGIVTWDAGHLVAWAEAEAERWKDPEAQPWGVKPRYFIAVDKDVSETGQKASARACDVLQEAGLTARYLLPPGDVQGGEKGCDWADVLAEKGWIGSVLGAMISGRMAGDALALAPRPRRRGEVHELWPVQEDENLGEAWEAPLGIQVEEARRRLAELLHEWFWNAEWWRGSTKDDKRRPWCLGVRVSTGTGKSSLIRQYLGILQGLRTVVVVKDRLRAEEYERAGFYWRHGRANMRSDKSDGWEYPWHCPLAGRGGEVERLSEGEHTIASEVCYAAHCPHGVKRALERAEARDKEVTGATARFYRENRELVDSAVPCQWLDHQLDAMTQPAIVVTADGLGEGDLSFLMAVEGKKPVLQKRIVVVDEGVEWGRVRTVSMGEITKYLKRIENLIPGAQCEVERLEALLRRAPNKDTEKALKAQKRELEAFHQALGILEQCARLVGQHPNTGGQCVDAGPELMEAGRALKKLIKEAGKGNAADWERPVWEQWVELVDVPLRAALEIATAADLGLLSIRDGELVVGFTHPVVGRALGEVPTLILDATLDSTAEAMIKKHGGTVESVMARQNVIVHIDPRRYNGAIPGHDKKRLRAEAERILAFVAEKKKEVNGQRVVALMQKRKALAVLEILKEREGPEALKELEALLQRVENDNAGAREALWDEINRYGIGWWGWCEEAHDAWSGCHLAIWDDKGLPREALRDLWEVHRHLKVREGGGDVADLPHYPSPQDEAAFEEGAWVRVGPYRQQSRCKLPKDPAIRAWELALHDDFVEQAIGRLRGTNHKEDADPLHVWIVGGRPHPRLFELGLREIRFEKVLEAESKAEKEARVHNERVQDAIMTGLCLEYTGQRATARAVQAGSRAPALWRNIMFPPSYKDSYHGGNMESGPGVRSETALEAARIIRAYMDKLDIVAPTDKDRQGAWDDAAADLMASALDVMRIPITDGRGAKVIEAVKEVSVEWPLYPTQWDDDRHMLVPNPKYLAGRRLLGAIFGQAKRMAEEDGDDPIMWYTRERLEKAIEDVLHSDVRDIRDPLYVGPVPEDVKEAVLKWLKLVMMEADHLVWSLQRSHRRRRRRSLE